MNRLTKKEKLPNVPYYVEIQEENYKTKNKKASINKLGKLEDIEEELGMELKVYHQIMSMLYCGEPNIIYVKDKDTIVQVGILEIDYCKKKIIFYKDSSYNDDYVYGFAQYGKTFALTKEELENENTK